MGRAGQRQIGVYLPIEDVVLLEREAARRRLSSGLAELVRSLLHPLLKQLRGRDAAASAGEALAGSKGLRAPPADESDLAGRAGVGPLRARRLAPGLLAALRSAE